MHKTIAIAAMMLLATSLPSLAQEVGKTQWNGHDVVLNADQTWYFDCGGYPAQMSKTIRMAFCFDPAEWQPGEPTGGQEFMYLSLDNTTGVTVIPDQNIYAAADLHKAVPEAAASNGQTTVDKIQASDAPSMVVDGKTWQGTRYVLGVDDTPFSYLDYHLSAEKLGTAQVIFWTVPGDEAVSEEKAKAFLAKIIYGD